MKRVNQSNKRERGAALVEFTIGALVFLTATFGVLEFSRLLWTHNALADAARRGTRYAVNHELADPDVLDNVKKVAVYGNPNGEGAPMVNGLTVDHVDVDYQPSSIPGVGFGYPDASVTVTITEFEFQFVVPIFGFKMTMPDYRTTLTAESAGTIPPDITPTPTPEASPTPEPTPGPTATPPPGPTGTPTPPPASPTPAPTPAPTATPTPSPTPRSCNKGEKPEFEGCVCRPPLSVNPANGKCG